MDYNKFKHYRANPFVTNDFIPVASMTNRKKKQFPSQIPQGEEHLSSRPGRRIFRDKIENNEIQRQNLLNSPQRYPFENRIAFDKSYRRNLDTIDIEGASSGTKVSESIKNKHKALEELRRRNQNQIKSPIVGYSLDEVYEQKRREIAEKIQKTVELRKAKEQLSENSPNSSKPSEISNRRSLAENLSSLDKVNQSQLQKEYERYVKHNSNQKYQGYVPHAYQFEGFQRYKRPEGSLQTLNSYNNGRIPQKIPNLIKQVEQNDPYRSLDHRSISSSQNKHLATPNPTSTRSSSIEPQTHNKQSYINNSFINVNNRHKSNPQYIDNYGMELQKRREEENKTKKIQDSLLTIYQNNKAQIRRYNPTNLSFNIAAKSALMGPIV